VKARVWREKPGDWRARLPGLRGTLAASSWATAYRMAWSMTIVPPTGMVVTTPLTTRRTCPCSAPGGSGICGCALRNGYQVIS
jgi:hypothetical protein